mmetsp:Transcript_25847/g.66830  ORF Transcript_25847/g.66830 Transcript_25847/m.66830 type:complete len:279 (-) Transcript_25847:223-1059(-)
MHIPVDIDVPGAGVGHREDVGIGVAEERVVLAGLLLALLALELALEQPLQVLVERELADVLVVRLLDRLLARAQLLGLLLLHAQPRAVRVGHGGRARRLGLGARRGHADDGRERVEVVVAALLLVDVLLVRVHLLMQFGELGVEPHCRVLVHRLLLEVLALQLLVARTQRAQLLDLRREPVLARLDLLVDLVDHVADLLERRALGLVRRRLVLGHLLEPRLRVRVPAHALGFLQLRELGAHALGLRGEQRVRAVQHAELGAQLAQLRLELLVLRRLAA